MGFDFEGVWWDGTEEELDHWIEYKRERVASFIKYGLSVDWYPDADNWIHAYWAGRERMRLAYAAKAKFFSKPSDFGLDGGAISKLAIQRGPVLDVMSKVFGRPAPTPPETLYRFDRGLDIDRLSEDVKAKKLYEIVLEELNWPKQ